MKKIIKLASAVCILTMLSSLSVGCQKNGTPGSSKAETTNQEVRTTPDKVTLRFSWWGGDARHKATLDAINKYMEKNPHVKIQAEYGGYDGYYQKMVTQLAGGAAPDIMQIDQIWIADLYKQGEMFVDLYSQTKQIDMTGYDKAFLKDYCEIQGKLQGLPKSVSTGTFIYNKDFFKKYSIDPNAKLDWDSLLEIGTKVHKQDPNAYLIQPHFDMMKSLMDSYMRQRTGQNFIKDDYTMGFDKKTITEAYSYFRKLLDNGVIVPFEETATITEADEHPKWKNGQTGIIFNFDSTIPKIKGNSSFELGVILPPVFADRKDTGIIIKPGVLTSINKKTKSLDECAKFMDYYNNDKDALVTLGDTRGVPPTEAAMKILVEANKLNPLLASAVSMGQKNAGMPINANSNNAEINKISQDVFTSMAFKKLTPEQAADELIKKVEAKLTELKNSAK